MEITLRNSLEFVNISIEHGTYCVLPNFGTTNPVHTPVSSGLE